MSPRERLACVRLLALLLALSVSGAARPGATTGSRQGTEDLKAEAFFFALSVKNVEESLSWYQRVLDFEAVRAVDLDSGPRIRLLRRDGAFLELIESPDARPLSEIAPELERRFLVHGVFKIGFRVDDLDRFQSRLRGLGVGLRGRVVSEEDGSMRSLQISDPDGNSLQIFELLLGETRR